MTDPSSPEYSERFWVVLEELENEVSELGLRILKREGRPPSSPKASTKPAAGDDDHSPAYLQRMKDLSRTVSTLRACLDAPAHSLPEAARRRNFKRIVHPIVEGNADTAKRARVGRAARRAGMTYRAWVQRYGMTDKLPTDG
jgi:hypothetical protein